MQPGDVASTFTVTNTEPRGGTVQTGFGGAPYDFKTAHITANEIGHNIVFVNFNF